MLYIKIFLNIYYIQSSGTRRKGTEREGERLQACTHVCTHADCITADAAGNVEPFLLRCYLD